MTVLLEVFIPRYMTAPALQPEERARLLMELYLYFDKMMWRAPTQYLSAAALALGAGTWGAANLDQIEPAWGENAEFSLAAAMIFAGLLLLFGANHMANSRKHRNLVRDELRGISGLDYFAKAKSFQRLPASRTAIALLSFIGAVMVVGGGAMVWRAISAPFGVSGGTW